MSANVLTYLCIALGSALGGMGRFWLSSFIAERTVKGFPWGTLLVNVSGSFVIGLLAAWVAGDERLGASPRFRAFFMVGLCGGYTTFSSFSLETLTLARAGAWLPAGAYIAASLVFCLVAVGLGFWLGRLFAR